jgi:hypothetical protein
VGCLVNYLTVLNLLLLAHFEFIVLLANGVVAFRGPLSNFSYPMFCFLFDTLY